MEKHLSKPLVSVITVNFNQAEVTCQLLESIRKQDYRNLEVIVVDNASRENPAEMLEKRFPEAVFVRSERNLGFAGGNNLGIQKARGDYFFFINNDTELPDGCLQKLLDLFLEVPKLGAVSPRILYFPTEKGQKNIIQYAGTTPVHPLTARNITIGWGEEDKGQYAVATPTAYVHGAAMLVPRRVCDRAGLMAEDFFLYYEELDWAERIRKTGYEIWVEPNAHIFHKESLTVSKMGALKTYYINRNRVYFMRRHIGGWRLTAFFAFLFLVTVPKNLVTFLLKGEFSNARAFLQGIFWNFTPAEKSISSPNKFEKIRLSMA